MPSSDTERSLLSKVKETISRYRMLYGGERVLVGLSGGPDSVCLLHLLTELRGPLKLTLSAMYVDHSLRPEDVKREMDFCRDLCKQWGVEFFTASVPTKDFARTNKLSIQEAARHLRYKVLQDRAGLWEADRLATGHTADDQAETVLLRLLRGAGMRGLSGIPPVRDNIIRPLIQVKRAEIEEYLAQKGIEFITDPSNLKMDYLRNRVRREIIPLLSRYNPNLVETLARTADIMREEDAFIESFVNKAMMRLISRKTDERVELFLSPLENMEIVILRRVLRRIINETMGFGLSYEHIESIIDLIRQERVERLKIQQSSTGSRLSLPRGVRVIKGYSTLIITRERPKHLGEYQLQVPGETLLKEAGIVLISSIYDATEIKDLGDGKNEAVFDLDTLSLPLTIRARRKGDYFYPLGLKGRKKLQDFFVDEKVPREERDTVPLLLSDDQIVWVVGHRIDERFKVTPSTRRVLRIVVRPAREVF